MIEPEAEFEGRIAGLDVVLYVSRLLLDRERLVVGERGPAIGQVEWRAAPGLKVAVLRREDAASVEIGDAERKMLVQPGRS